MLCAIPIVREVVPTDVNIRGEEDAAVGGAREAVLGDRRAYRHSCSSASRCYAATATLPC